MPDSMKDFYADPARVDPDRYGGRDPCADDSDGEIAGKEKKKEGEENGKGEENNGKEEREEEKQEKKEED